MSALRGVPAGGSRRRPGVVVPAAAAILLLATALAPGQDAPILPPPGMTGPAPSTAKPAPKKPPAAKPKETAPAAAVTLTPRAWARSVYQFEGRLESGIQDVTFETPPAYKDSFAFWAARMKGTQRTEMIQHVSTTRDAVATGVPFRRQVSRYMLDLNEHGQVKTMGGQLNRDVQTLAWEGRLDPQGRIAEIKRVAAPEDPAEVDRLSFPLLDHSLPVLDAPRSLAPGESFTVETTLPLPSRLTINGLEDTAAHLTRVLTLREVRGRQAVFDIRASYALDPATPPKAPRTTCVISGGGDGEATFDLDGGYFLSARLKTRMLIDIEAPLRRLPDQPEGTDPGTGKSHLVVVLTMSGKQSAAQLFVGTPEADGGAAPEKGTGDVSGGSDPTE